MDPLVIGIILIAIALVAVLVWRTSQQRRTDQLRRQYGVEYDHTERQLGRRRAEHELLSREKRVEHLDVRPLTPSQRTRFTDEWRRVQAQFVDDPEGAVAQGDAMVEEVMKARGYPLAGFDQRIADLSVHHASVVQNYRAAREIATRQRQGQATTEDLRRAMVYYRELFEDLVEDRRAPDRDVGLRVEREERVESSIGRQAPRPPGREVEP